MAMWGNEDLSWSVVSGTSGSGNAGTTFIKNMAGHFGGVYVGVPSTGSVSYYDAAQSSDITAANLIMIVSNIGSTVPSLYQPTCVVKKGLTAVTSVGTTNQTVFWN